MPRTAPAATAAVVRAFSRELSRAGGLLSPDYLASGLTVGEARCLYELGHAEGLEVSALAERVDLDLGHVSRVVSRLVERGLVSKQVSASDARARAVGLTAKGARHLAQLDRRANERVGAWLAAKPAPAVVQLTASLQGFLALTAGTTTSSAGAGSRAAAVIAAPSVPTPASQSSPPPRIAIRGPRPGSIGHIIARHGEIYCRDLGYPAAFERYVVQAFGELMASFTPPRDRIFIAERGGQFAGSIAMKGLPRATARVRFLLVEPEARGLGIARRLLRQLLAHARASGDRRVVLDTASDLVAARALYTAHSFRLTASIPGEAFLPAGVASEHWQLDF